MVQCANTAETGVLKYLRQTLLYLFIQVSISQPLMLIDVLMYTDPTPPDGVGSAGERTCITGMFSIHKTHAIVHKQCSCHFMSNTVEFEIRIRNLSAQSAMEIKNV